MEKKTEWNVGYWLIAILLFVLLQHWWSSISHVEPVPYSEFERALKEGRIAEVLISD
jgi:cell division protease FtsH